ncbi:MAG TPA: ACT domain-containing protein [Actinomycetota bacterium]|nr:ACT domain-containing protein [Actinomycetota bacterium]
MSERPAPVGRLLADLRSLDRAYSAGHHGRWSGRRRAELVDACIRDLASAAGMPEGVALVALGGYGRGVLAPGSDLDLLILHDEPSDPDVEALAERLLYPLWDAGLRVGHAVRTPDACLEIAAERLDATTAMLDGRVLAGSGSAWDEVRSALVGLVRGDPRAFAERLAADREARRDRFGSVSSLLEPELKDGVGGLRDVHALGWLQTAIGAPLEDAGIMRESERRSVEAAEEFLIRVRGALHLESGRGADRLLAELQPSIAPVMGFADEPGLPAVDGLMRSVFEQARQVEHVSASVFDRFLRGSSPPVPLDATAEGILRAFAAVARDGDVMPAASLDAVAAVSIDAELAWDEPIRAAFLELLRCGPGAVRGLETLDRVGLLERYVPAWGPVRCRPQRDPYHRASVDVHLLDSLAVVGRLLEDPGDDPTVTLAVHEVPDVDALRLGALLHDIGKTGEGHHVEIGARVAGEMLDHMGVSDPTAELARFLVAEHLLLSDTATRRDLDDEGLIVAVADRIRDPGRLAALYLLTLADAEATGPLAWTPWRASLVRELVAKVRHVLERDDVGWGTAERLAARAEEIRATLAGEDPDGVERFLLRMPRGYVLTVPIDRVPVHHRLLAPSVGRHEVRTHAGEGSRAGAYDLVVVAADRPGLLSMIAGALSLAGLSILSAQVFTTDDGVAVDLFEIEGAFEPEVGEERWREFRTTLRKAIEGRLSLDHRVREKRRYYPAAQGDVPVRVEIDNEASDFFTVIEVGAPDRLGLLFDITRTLAELQLDVHLAKVATFGGRVVDAFYVRDDLGRRVDDLDRVRELEDALRARLAP